MISAIGLHRCVPIAGLFKRVRRRPPAHRSRATRPHNCTRWPGTIRTCTFRLAGRGRPVHLTRFTARCYASAVTSHGPVSVSVCVGLSVTSRCSTKTAKRRITKIKPHDSTGTLVFWRQRSPRNSTGVTPYESAKCRWGGSKSATFDKLPAIGLSRKR